MKTWTPVPNTKISQFQSQSIEKIAAVGSRASDVKNF
jgi:hypothetical protein